MKNLHRLAREFSGFVLVGAANVVLTYGLYVVLHLFFPYWLAYCISFAAGIAFSLYANASFVFAHALTPASMLQFGAFYGLSFAAGLGIVMLLVEKFGVPPALAPLGAIAVMIPINFLGSRFAIRGKWLRRSPPGRWP